MERDRITERGPGVFRGRKSLIISYPPATFIDFIEQGKEKAGRRLYLCCIAVTWGCPVPRG